MQSEQLHTEDFIVHELTHARQGRLLREHQGESGWEIGKRRGAHRDRGWYGAVADACPRYFDVELPSSCWPTGPRTRSGTLTEFEMTRRPKSLRDLAAVGDPRLPRLTNAA